MNRRPRFILATPICDGHDVAICAIARILRREGADAIYIGFNKSPQQIVKAAVEEDASAIALSSYNGGHTSFIRETLREAKRRGIPRTPLFCGGGGTILQREVPSSVSASRRSTALRSTSPKRAGTCSSARGRSVGTGPLGRPPRMVRTGSPVG